MYLNSQLSLREFKYICKYKFNVFFSYSKKKMMNSVITLK